MKRPQVFARSATGLVRELGFLDQFLVSQAGMNWFPTIPTVALLAPFYFPGANLALVTLIGCLPAFALAAVYAPMSAALPRSGGDYVWSSRILGPLYGSIQFVFMLAGVLIGAIGICNWSAVAIGLNQTLLVLGIANHNTSLINYAVAMSQASVGFPISVVLVVVTTGISLLGLRFYSTFQRGSYGFIYLVTAVFAVALLTLGFSKFPSTFDGAMRIVGYKLTYDAIIREASTHGPIGVGFNLQNTLLAAIPWGFLAYGGFNFGTYFSGETKNVKSTMFLSLFFSVAVSTVLMILFYVGIYNDFGVAFINSASYVAATNPSYFPTLPTVNLFVGLLDPIAGVLINVGLFVGWLVVCCVYTLEMARMVFAAAFDRLIPTRLSEVNEKFHSPHLAIILIGCLSIVYMTVYWNFGFAATWLNVSLLLPIAFLLPLVAALAFPVVKPQLFKQTVGRPGYGLLVEIGSVIGIACFLFYIFAETFPILSGVFLGTSLALALAVVAAAAMVGALIYFTAKIRAKRLGLDLSLTYAEVPPE